MHIVGIPSSGVQWVKTVIGSRAFRSAAPSVWNLIPVNIRTAPSLESFRVKLKTHYFQLAFC